MQLPRNRIEALTDGVFAVAITLLVLDIKVPELPQDEARNEINAGGPPPAEVSRFMVSLLIPA
jgi:uncharacterized membrane protein